MAQILSEGKVKKSRKGSGNIIIASTSVEKREKERHRIKQGAIATGGI